jgi:hypothetical protein
VALIQYDYCPYRKKEDSHVKTQTHTPPPGDDRGCISKAWIPKDYWTHQKLRRDEEASTQSLRVSMVLLRP